MTFNAGQFSNQAGVLAIPPSGAFPPPPVQSVLMRLPLGSLSWENFERLCYRLALFQGSFDHVARYGKQGQSQGGIDVFARKPDGRYTVWQAKRYKTYKPANLKSAVETFLAGRWVEQSDTFVIAVQASLDDTKLQDEIERQTTKLANKNIVLEVLGGDALIERIRPHQTLVSAFFGRHWLEAFYGDAIDPNIKDRLDGIEFDKVRAQLATFYTTRFSDLDQGMVGARFATTPGSHRSLALLERFAMTDVFIRERTSEKTIKQNRLENDDISARELRAEIDGRSLRSANPYEVRRVSAADWLIDGNQLAILGDAGAGKSTLLRAIALDLLGDQSVFKALGQRWGDRLPIILPFAKWARATSIQDGEISLRDLVAQSLQPLLTSDIVSLVNRAVDEQRIVLIVDGLDEWSNEQAARTALQTLLTFVQVHNIPTLVSGRPQGLRRIGSLPQSWSTAELAPLSSTQQGYLANVWFRHLQPHSTGGKGVGDNNAAWRADRFLRELSSDAALGELAGTPLLFVGLLFLSLCNVVLPRNRTQALRDLVKLLNETHPEARATAAGEGRARFEYAGTPEIRLFALGALAFASRRDGGDAGYSRNDASKAILEELTNRGFKAETASAVARELLAVNAETVGLIIEKGPDDIGFAHASLEEYLAATHIQSWPFNELTRFVSVNAGSARWHKVLGNLVGINERPDEIEQIVDALETADLDIARDFSRRQLLSELAFSQSSMSSQTAQRLANRTFETIEGFGPLAERTAMVKLTINGLSDPLLRTAVEDRLRRWVPRREDFPQELFIAIASWEQSADQLEALIRGLGDENRGAARTAARCLATVYKADKDVLRRLISLVSSDAELAVVVSAIEALVLGWPEANLESFIDEAAVSRSPVLVATAIWARVKLNSKTDADRARCLQLVDDNSGLDYFDKEIADEALLEGWPDDDDVIKKSLAWRSGGGLRREVASAALLNTEPGRPEVKKWILEELASKFPFNSMRRGLWSKLIKFAKHDFDINEAVVSAITSEDGAHRRYEYWPIIAQLGDVRLRDNAISDVRSKKSYNKYWSLLPLLSGWADDPDVKTLVREVIALPDDELGMLVALLPDLYAAPKEARARLIDILHHQPGARVDLIVKALAELGCDEEDEEAVQAILPFLRDAKPNAEPLMAYHQFSAHQEIRDQALIRLKQPEPPIHVLAKAYPNEPPIKEAALSAISSVPLSLRAAIATAAGIGADRHKELYSVLESYKEESDFHVSVQLAVDYYQLRLARGDVDGVVDYLTAEIDQPGIKFEENRATAFAGLVVMDHPQAVLTTTHVSGKVRLQSYRTDGLSSTLGALLAKKWDMLKSKLGLDFVDAVFSDDGSAWNAIARFSGPNQNMRRDFFEWCKSEENIGLASLLSLAEFWPQNGVLLEHALRILNRKNTYTDHELSIKIAAAEILRDQFNSPQHVAELNKMFELSKDTHTAIALAIVDPDAPSLQQDRVPTLEIGKKHRDWLAAAQIASRLDPPETFATIVHAAAEREIRPGWSHEPQITEVLAERVIHDAHARSILRTSIDDEISPDAFVACVTLLARAGHLDSEILNKCAASLALEQARKGVPLAVLDFNLNEVRPYAHILMEFIQMGGSR
ncbi:NACHT domain-containing protein [Tritonibacter scottomollicae]|uniref:NACHT domain-containing protein n=1 Tax=Tritonibacter scottomollicae TaxID=483013 RepID=UPI003AA94157